MVSVVIPIHDVAVYLNRCVESVYNQTIQNWELILVDDGSTDGSERICDQWAQRDPRIKAVHTEYIGVSNARNVGIELSTGDYIMFVDSDDYVEPDMMEKLLSAILESRADVSVCSFVYEFETEEIHNQLKRLELTQYQFSEKMLMSGKDFVYMMKADLYTACAVVWNKLYRKEFIGNRRFPVGRYHEDEMWIFPLMYSAKAVTCISYVGYHYVRRGGSIMGKGVRYGDTLDMLVDRAIFCIEHDEKELTERAQSALLLYLHDARQALPNQRIRAVYWRRLKINWKMFCKGWISLPLFLKRAIRCLIAR